MKNSSSVKTPQDRGFKLTRGMCEGGYNHENTMTNVPSRIAFEYLMYHTVDTRTDLATKVEMLS